MLPILMYHSVDESGSILSVAPRRFEQQMAWLHAAGGRALTLEAAGDLLAAGLPLPERAFVLTFDDGFEAIHRYAFPILQRFGFTATVFLVAGYVGKKNDWPGQPAAIAPLPLMSWAQIYELNLAGFELGSHTLSHPRLDQLAPAQAREEIISSKTALEDGLGRAVRSFAYPYGRYSASAAECVRETYASACTTRLALADRRSDLHLMPRADASVLWAAPAFRNLFHPLMPAYLEGRRRIRRLAGALFQKAWV